MSFKLNESSIGKLSRIPADSAMIKRELTQKNYLHKRAYMRTVLIDREPVELYKILKFEGLASSGAEAKLFISTGMVSVNSEVETRKRRKMRSGDVLSIDGHELVLALEKSIPSDDKSDEQN